MNARPSIDRNRYQFFRKYAGGIVGESALTAAALARADEALEAAIDTGGARVRIEEDSDPDVSWMKPGELEAYRDGRLLMLYVGIDTTCDRGTFHPATGVGGVSVYSDSDPHVRVLLAELASEAGIV